MIASYENDSKALFCVSLPPQIFCEEKIVVIALLSSCFLDIDQSFSSQIQVISTSYMPSSNGMPFN